jgi:hypothetical protein
MIRMHGRSQVACLKVQRLLTMQGQRHNQPSTREQCATRSSQSEGLQIRAPGGLQQWCTAHEIKRKQTTSL